MKSWVICLRVNDILTVFSKFTFIFQMSHHSNNLSKSSCHETQSLGLRIILYNTQSFVNNRTEDNRPSLISFTKIKDNKGPKTEPYTTPDVTPTSWEDMLLISALWLRALRYCLIQAITDVFVLCHSSFSINREWGPRSKAFLKSVKIASATNPLSSTLSGSCTSSVSCLTQERPLRKSCCWE